MAHSRIRRGFSLIESAIVLGIIGLIIGGIWVAASAVQNRATTNDVLQILTQAHETALHFRKNITSITVAGDITSLIAQKGLPGRFIYGKDAFGGDYINNGWQWLQFYHYYVPGVTPLFLRGSIYLYSTADGSTYTTKPDLCLEISKRLLNAALGPPTGVGYSIKWTGSSTTWSWGTAKPDPTTLSTICSATKQIDFFWQL